MTSCEEEKYPRPRGYPKIELPATHEYKVFSSESCPFTFEYPAHGKLARSVKDSCVFDLRFPEYDFKWHFTYRNIPASGKPRHIHEDEYRELIMQHVTKLDNLLEEPIQTQQGWGLLYEMYGELGAPAQVIFGDTTHIFMTSFYFDQAVNQDSLKPLIDWVKDDLRYMANSVKWAE